MRRGAATLLAGLVLVAPAAGAQSCGERTALLLCEMPRGKMLSVCIDAAGASYGYGPAGAPELALSQPLSQMQGMPWPGAGRAIWETLVFTNNDVTYEVYTSVDRMEETPAMSGGVSVSRGGKVLTQIECLEGTAQVSTFAVSDAFTAAGLCYDRTAERFRRSCAN